MYLNVQTLVQKHHNPTHDRACIRSCFLSTKRIQSCLFLEPGLLHQCSLRNQSLSERQDFKQKLMTLCSLPAHQKDTLHLRGKLIQYIETSLKICLLTQWNTKELPTTISNSVSWRVPIWVNIQHFNQNWSSLSHNWCSVPSWRNTDVEGKGSTKSPENPRKNERAHKTSRSSFRVLQELLTSPRQEFKCHSEGLKHHFNSLNTSYLLQKTQVKES